MDIQSSNFGYSKINIYFGYQKLLFWISGIVISDIWNSSLSRVSILTRDIDIANLSVRPSVRYVLIPDENGLTYRHSFFTYGSPIILVLHALNIFTPPAGR